MNRYDDSDFILGLVPSVNALLGTITERRSKTRGRPNDVYVWDERKDSPLAGRHENGAWVSHYCEPSAELRAAYDRVNGGGDFSLSCLRIVPWSDGSVRLFGEPRCHIGSTPLAFERSEQGWFFTFGYGHTLPSGERLDSRYLIVREPDYDKARAEMVRLRDLRWAFQYPLSELEGQVRTYALREITAAELQP